MGLLDRVRDFFGAAGDDGAEHHVVRGFPVVVENTRPDIATPVVLQRLDEALGLIERHQPWRFAHLTRESSGSGSCATPAAAPSSPTRAPA